MEIKALKSGKFAHPEPAQGMLVLREGRDYTVDGKMAASLIDCGWGEAVAVTPADETPVEKPLHKMIKSELINYAEERDLGMDPTLKNDDMVTFITEAMAEEDE